MFSRSVRIYRYLQMYSFFIFLIHENQTFVLSGVADVLPVNDKHVARAIQNTSDITWAKISINPGNDKHNVQLLKNTRMNILKLSLMITCGVFILFLISAIISVIVYCAKKK